MQRVGRMVINLYNTTYSGSGGNTLHLETSLWGGGSPHGNMNLLWVVSTFMDTDIIVVEYGGDNIFPPVEWWIIIVDINMEVNPGSSCYVGSNGNVYIKLPRSSYYGFAIDFIQHPWYDARDCTRSC